MKPIRKKIKKPNKFLKKVLTNDFFNHIIGQTEVQEKNKREVSNMKESRKHILEQVKIFGETYKLKVIYKYTRKPNLKIKTREKELEVYLPYKYRKVDNSIIIEMLVNKMYDEIAKSELDTIMEKVRTTIKFAPEDYKIMRLDKQIAKCFANRLIINPEIVKYRLSLIHI